MSDHDNLRDRIEEVIWKRTTLSTEITMFVAQAIIDELELTVEKGQFGVTMKRVVGKWERLEQEPRP